MASKTDIIKFGKYMQEHGKDIKDGYASNMSDETIWKAWTEEWYK